MSLLTLLLPFMLFFASCDVPGNIVEENPTHQDPSDTPSDTPSDDPSDEPSGAVKIGTITSNGTYTVRGTVVAVGQTAYVVADETGAILIYTSNHGRKVYDMVEVSGSALRYRDSENNVFQINPQKVSLISKDAAWTYNPVALDATAFDALVGKKATCADITFEGTLTIDGTYVNVRPDGAGRTSSFKYVSVSDYTSLDGQKVVVSAFVTGTYNYLYMLPYKVEVKQPSWMVCGTHDGWGSGVEMEKKGEYWVAYNLRFPAGTANELKLRFGQNWADGEFGAADTGIVLSTDTFCSVVSADGGNIPVMAGTYDIWLDPAGLKVYAMTPGKDISSATQAGQKPDVPEGCVWISSVTSDGNYTVQGTVVAAGNSAYVVADVSGALMVYGYGHGRSLGDVVKLTGAVSRYKSDVRNVFQMSNAEVELIRTGDTWSYNPEQLDQYDINALVGGTATCSEVAVTGVLQRSGNYLNFNVEGASHQVSFYYVDTSLYSDISDGATVEMKGYIVGTGDYLKILPYSVTVVSGPSDDPDVPSDSDPTAKKWMELPAMNSTSLGYYYHSFPLNGKTYRNYSFGWDNSNKVAIWVAYPLCNMYTNTYAGENVRHEEYFIRDPLLGDASPYPGPGYAGNYDRGHQIPSADRQCSELANGQTYYGTNMTAQSNPLNGGPWANLEGAVRNFAKSSSDTTYVVTGCYVEDSVEWSTDSDGMRIKVPTAYFKAILVLKNGNWTGGAYWTPHVEYSDDFSDWAVSIDWLENKTGLDFFVNLPSEIGDNAAAAIEAAEPNDSEWWN